MRKFLPIICLFSFSVAAEVNPTLSMGLKALSDSSRLGTGVDCDDPNAPPWCRDLYKSACAFKKSTNKLKALNDKVNTEVYRKVPKGSPKKVYNDAGEAAIKMAEEIVYTQGRLVRNDVKELFTQVTKTIVDHISSHPQISQEKKREMVKQINEVKLMSGYEYVEDLVAWGTKQQPKVPKEDVRHEALEMYMAACGTAGLEKNSFLESGIMVVCPGTVYSLEDYNTKGKEEMLIALSATFGHEISHNADHTVTPNVYNKMKSCYEDVHKRNLTDKAFDEVVGTYWGAVVLAERLRKQKLTGQEALRTIALSMDGFCDVNAQTLDSEFRFNAVLARTPEIRQVLQCEPPSIDSPACLLDGKNPKPER